MRSRFPRPRSIQGGDINLLPPRGYGQRTRFRILVWDPTCKRFEIFRTRTSGPRMSRFEIPIYNRFEHKKNGRCVRFQNFHTGSRNRVLNAFRIFRPGPGCKSSKCRFSTASGEPDVAFRNSFSRWSLICVRLAEPAHKTGEPRAIRRGNDAILSSICSGSAGNGEGVLPVR
jgi:hypothetical protein